jgi:ribosome-binding protein aMBF1 (putative translation factor)
MLSSQQIRAARALLGWDQGTLAEKAGVSVITVKRLEAASGDKLHARFETVMKIKNAVEREGIEFVRGQGRIGVVHLQKQRTKAGKRRD